MSTQTDDVGVFGSKLSDEYSLVAKAFNLSRKDLFTLSERAAETIFGDEKQKQRLHALVKDAKERWMHVK